MNEVTDSKKVGSLDAVPKITRPNKSHSFGFTINSSTITFSADVAISILM